MNARKARQFDGPPSSRAAALESATTPRQSSLWHAVGVVQSLVGVNGEPYVIVTWRCTGIHAARPRSIEGVDVLRRRPRCGIGVVLVHLPVAREVAA